MWSQPYPSKQNMRGVAVIVALFIMAVVAAIAVAMMSRLQRDTLRASLIIHSVQAELYAQGSVDWAKDSLRNNYEKKQTGKLVDEMPIVSVVQELNGYRIASTVEDAQARFDLNHLIVQDETIKTSFKKFLQTIDPKLNDERALAITQALISWMQNNTHDKTYAEAKPSYRSPQQLMGTASELRLIKGMTPQLYAAMLPYIIALPQKNMVNVQTASIPVLMSLSRTLTWEAAKAIAEYRKTTPFTTTGQFLKFEIINNNTLFNEKWIGVLSDYFLVTTEVSTGEQKLILYTLLDRSIVNNKPTVSIVWQSKGSL